MSERKVLNKYYPPDYDPSKIPKLHLQKNRQFTIRIMVPFNCRCNNCGGYIYKGKKFNSRSEMVTNENYLGLRVYRFYIRCPTCVSEIAFKTDPEKADYELEAGATRNFEPIRTAEQLALKEQKEKEEEEKNNPMKVLENRTKSSRQEMELIETLEELKEMNARHGTVDHEYMLKLHQAYDEQLQKLMDEEDEKFVRSVFGSHDGSLVRRIKDDEGVEDDKVVSNKLVEHSTKTFVRTGATDVLVDELAGPSVKRPKINAAPVKSYKQALSSLVKRKTPTNSSDKQATNCNEESPASSNEAGKCVYNGDDTHSSKNMKVDQSSIESETGKKKTTEGPSSTNSYSSTSSHLSTSSHSSTSGHSSTSVQLVKVNCLNLVSTYSSSSDDDNEN